MGLKDAIDRGYVEGPRILPSGAFISQTGGEYLILFDLIFFFNNNCATFARLCVLVLD